ncbi:hypothetical protein [Pendulispora albinea]|uniref:Secreted protein n=1 Tax=Pendulispora albinea TaxID=2741071 RepID=A0ABZ2LU63_9BACT
MKNLAFIRLLAAAFAAVALACTTGCSGDASSEPTDLNDSTGTELTTLGAGSDRKPVPPPPEPVTPHAAAPGGGGDVPPPPEPVSPGVEH